MKKLVIATGAILVLGIGTSTHAASEINCMIMWDKADVNRDGTLKGEEATAYLDAMKRTGKKYVVRAVDQLSRIEFMDACKDDAFKVSFYRAQLL